MTMMGEENKYERKGEIKIQVSVRISWIKTRWMFC